MHEVYIVVEMAGGIVCVFHLIYEALTGETPIATLRKHKKRKRHAPRTHH